MDGARGILPAPSPPPWDDRLTDGFEFACRPDCALCCYTAPRVDAADRQRWAGSGTTIRLVDGAGGTSHIPEHAPGGACRMLAGFRCTIHRVRPGVCASFPVDVYAGRGRWQASVVLSCPGLSLRPLGAERPGSPPPDPAGGRPLAAERAAARARTATPAADRAFRGTEARRATLARRGRRRIGWEDPVAIQRALREQRRYAWTEAWPGELPPAADEGAAYLPLFFDRRAGPVALARSDDAWELLELGPRGSGESLGRFRIADAPPSLSSAGEEMLAAYLRYWLERDSFWDIALESWLSEPPGASFAERVGSELASIAATVVARGSVRRLARGEPRLVLDGPGVEDGIRATDADLLDRPALGAIL